MLWVRLSVHLPSYLLDKDGWSDLGPRTIMLLQGRETAGVPTAWELEKLKDFPGINLDTYSMAILLNKPGVWPMKLSP